MTNPTKTTPAGEPVPAGLAHKLGQPSPADYLGPRERQVLAAMARGLSNRAIGVELGITTDTVKTHGRRLFAKLGVSTRMDAVAAGRRLGLVSGRCPMCGHGASGGRTASLASRESRETPPGVPGPAGGPR